MNSRRIIHNIITRDAITAVNSDCKAKLWNPYFITNKGQTYVELRNKYNPNNWEFNFAYRRVTTYYNKLYNKQHRIKNKVISLRKNRLK